MKLFFICINSILKHCAVFHAGGEFFYLLMQNKWNILEVKKVVLFYPYFVFILFANQLIIQVIKFQKYIPIVK